MNRTNQRPPRPATEWQQLGMDFAKRKLFFALSSSLIAAVLLVQIMIGADLLVLAIAGTCAIAVGSFLTVAPQRLASWFALVLFLQLFGIALLYKTFKLDRFESGLLAPEASIFACALVIIPVGLSSLFGTRDRTRDYRLWRFYGDGRTWNTAGLIFLLIGEGATWLSYNFNASGGAVVGAFNPLVHFKIAGMAFLANYVLKTKRLISPLLALVIVASIFESLVLNSKSIVVYQLTAYVLAVLVGPIGPFRKLRTVVVCCALLFFADRLLFPTIHLLRTEEFKEASVESRMDMIKHAIVTDRYTWSDLKTMDSGTIFDDYNRFMPTDDGFVSRFGSLGYLDLTIGLGDPSVSKMPFWEFFSGCIVKALPAQLSPNKDYFSLADKLWVTIDPNFQIGGMATMGTIASSRLVFGGWPGLVVVGAVLLLILWLWQIWYGSDIHAPLIQFLLIDSVAGLIDGDIQSIFMYLMRFFWQELGIIAFAGWLTLMIAHRKSGSAPRSMGPPAFFESRADPRPHRRPARPDNAFP